MNNSIRIEIQGIPQTVDKEIIWEIEGVTLSNNITENSQILVLNQIDCESQDWELAEILCEERSGLRELNVTITDSGFETTLQWTIQVEVYITPKTLVESLFSFLGSTLGIVVVIVILLSTIGGVALVGMKIRENRLIAEAYAEFKVELNPQGGKSGLGGTELPAAPDLSSLLEMQSSNSTTATESIPMLESTKISQPIQAQEIHMIEASPILVPANPVDNEFSLEEE